MKILVTGSRDWTDFDTIYMALYGMPKNTVIINGACKGADKLSTEVSRLLGFEYREYPADWKRWNLAAGPIRNRAMYDKEQPDLVIAFHPDISKSKGTKDMVKYAKSKGCPIVYIRG